MFKWSIAGEQAAKWPMPNEVTLPKPGNIDGGETWSINVEQRVGELAATQDQKKAFEIVKELACGQTQMAPKYNLGFECPSMVPVNTSDFNVSAADDSGWDVYRPLTLFGHKGKINAK